MIHGKYFSSQDDCSAIFALRKEVFCSEQGFSEELERDAFDAMAFYALVYDENEQPAATGRLYIDAESRFHIGRMCTRADQRRQGLGDLVIRMLLDLSLRLNAPYVVVSAQLSSVHWYAKYGFEPVGDIYEEEGKPHQLMRVNTENICLDHCGGHCPMADAQQEE